MKHLDAGSEMDNAQQYYTVVYYPHPTLHSASIPSPHIANGVSFFQYSAIKKKPQHSLICSLIRYLNRYTEHTDTDIALTWPEGIYQF